VSFNSLTMTVAAFCWTALAVGSASAEENLSLFALGGQSCIDWREHPIPNEEAALRKWFVAAVDQQAQSGGYRLDVVEGTTPDDMIKAADDYCRVHPLDGLAVAATTLINELAARKATIK
jgi:hypothetical protein